MSAPRSVWWPTAATAGALAGATFLTHGAVSRFVDHGWLALALAFGSVQLTAVVALMGYILVSRRAEAIRRRRALRLAPGIRAALAGVAVGDGSPATLARRYRRHPREVEDCLMELLPALTGEAEERLVEAAAAVGLLARFQEACRATKPAKRLRAVRALAALAAHPEARGTLVAALDDADHRVRTEASLALIRSGDPALVETVFDFATGRSLLVRALLVEELRRHALLLAGSAIPAALASDDAGKVRVTLELVAAWHVTLDLPDVAGLLAHPDAAVRAAAFRTLPWVAVPGDVTALLAAGLADADAGVAAAAAFAAGRLHARAAIPRLRQCLQERPGRVALTAAYALAEIGEPGLDALELAAGGPDVRVSRPALEALERARIGRLYGAGL